MYVCILVYSQLVVHRWNFYNHAIIFNFYIYLFPTGGEEILRFCRAKTSRSRAMYGGCKSCLTNCFCLKGPQKFACTEKVSRKSLKPKFTFRIKIPSKCGKRRQQLFVYRVFISSQGVEIYIKIYGLGIFQWLCTRFTRLC